MSCLSELDGMRYCDGDLSTSELRLASAHLDGCDACRVMVAALMRENDVLRALVSDRPGGDAGLRSTVSGVALALAAAVAMRWTLVGADEWSLVAAAFSGVATALRLIAYAGYPAALTGALLFLLAVFISTRRGRPRAAIAAGLVLVCGAQPSALTRLVGERTATVAAGTVVHDDVLAGGHVVQIDGTIDGDLYAMASRVEITGAVTGRVYAVAEVVHVSGRVGSLTSVGRTHALNGHAQSWRAWGEEIRLLPGGETSGEFVAAGRVVRMEGVVRGQGRAYGQSLHLGPAARVGGLVARLGDKDGMHVAPGAVVDGPQDVRAGPRSRWSLESLVGQGVTGGITFVVGLVLWHRRRRFLDLSAHRVAAWWPSLYRGTARVLIGGATCVALAVTLVGAPLAVAGLALLLAALIVGKAIVATFVADHLRRVGDPPFGVRLLAALLILAVLSLPPWGIGATLSALVSVVGLGAAVGRTPGRLMS